VCDDSQQSDYRQMIDEFCAEHAERCRAARRPDNRGFKAGNLNHAIQTEVQEEWVPVVDADQVLPPDYLRQLVAHLPASPDGCAFVQAAHEATVNEQSSLLQQALAPGAKFFCQRDMPLRIRFGFVPMLGHGAIISLRAWRECGGFPEVVFEDFAFALAAANHGLRGKYVGSVVSYESLPFDFHAFVIRVRKYASGTAELFRREIFPFLVGRATLVEKWDLVLMLGWYVLMPLIFANGFLAAYVCHRYWTEGVPLLHPLLPYLFA
jgi:cellulose synthase/poly-beta-1,6-N-acetylglucosamine synthase-like glycosyltransferase